MLLHPQWMIRATLLLGLGFMLASAAGCDTGPAFVGTWKTDLTPYQNSPSGDSALARYLSPAASFSLKFREDGRLVSSWNEEGKEVSKSGTWKMVADEGLRWRLMVKLPPDEDEWELRIISRSNRRIAVDAIGEFQNKGGPLEFKAG